VRFVEARVVDTHPPFPALVLYKNRIGKPLRLIHFLDESNDQKSCDLLPDGPALLHIKTAQTLLDQLGA
jgi:hypothetical protein